MENITKGNPKTYARLRRQADIFNRARGTLKPYDCSICNNKGYVQGVQFEPMYGDYMSVIVECKCRAKRETLIRASESGLGEYLGKTLDDFQVDKSWQHDIRNQAIAFMKNAESNAWFTVLGQSGCGKTLICSIIANHLLNKCGRTVAYVTWTDFIGQLKRNMMNDRVGCADEYLEYVKTVDVLFLDELLKKYNETDLKYIIEIINYRYTNNLKTIITSERELTELLKIDEATFSRVVEKSKGYITSIPKDIRKNYRLKGMF